MLSKETYIQIYSYCLDVIKCEDFWEDVDGDEILPHLLVKKKDQKRCEEGKVGKNLFLPVRKLELAIHEERCIAIYAEKVMSEKNVKIKINIQKPQIGRGERKNATTHEEIAIGEDEI